MTEHQQDPSPLGEAIARAIKRAQIQAARPILERVATRQNPYLHDEQKRITWGSTLMLWAGRGQEGGIGANPIFAKVSEWDDIIDACSRGGYDTGHVMAVIQARIDRGILPTMTYSSLIPGGSGAELHASWVWPLDETVWEEAALRHFDVKQMPDWVLTHLSLTEVAWRAHDTRVAPLVKAAQS